MNTKIKFISKEELPKDISLIAELNLFHNQDSCKIYFTNYYYRYFVNFWVSHDNWAGIGNCDYSKYFICNDIEECLQLINFMTDDSHKNSIISLGSLHNKRWWSYLPNWMFLCPETTKYNFVIRIRKYILEYRNSLPETDLSKTEKMTINNWIEHIGLNIPKYSIPKTFFPELRQSAS